MINIDLNVMKNKINNLLRHDTSVKIISIILAIIIWFVISIGEYPTIKKMLYNVPILINTEGTFAEANSLQAELLDDAAASVYIVGDRGQVGNPTTLRLIAVIPVPDFIHCQC